MNPAFLPNGAMPVPSCRAVVSEFSLKPSLCPSHSRSHPSKPPNTFRVVSNMLFAPTPGLSCWHSATCRNGQTETITKYRPPAAYRNARHLVYLWYFGLVAVRSGRGGGAEFTRVKRTQTHMRLYRGLRPLTLPGLTGATKPQTAKPLNPQNH